MGSRASTGLPIEIRLTTAKQLHQPPPFNNWLLPGRCCEGCIGPSERTPATDARLLPFLLDHLLDFPPERRSHRRQPSEFSLQMIPAFGATGDMLFDSEHFSLGKFFEGVALHHQD